MKRRSVPLFRIGLFVILGFVVLFVFVFAIGSQDKMFNRKSEIYAKFKTVSGLKSGAQVQYSGIPIGSVTDIALPDKPTDSVRVTMKIINKALHLVRANSLATISTEGIIGDKIIVIEDGLGPAGAVGEGALVQGKSPKDYTQAIDTLEEAVKNVNRIASEASLILQGLRNGEGSVGKLLTDDALYRDIHKLSVESQATMIAARGQVERVGAQVERVGVRVENLSVEVDDIVSGIKRGEGSVGKLLKDEALYNDLRATSDNIRISSYDMRDALAKVSLGGGRFAEVMEALKHNFLVKGYFEERGYWDAPQFEMTIDRKIDSLNKLQNRLDAQLKAKASQ
ncbi:MAG TPA: MlaD family protein [Candidatus Kapabacteria bacterium]|nr:MlaD family protein [Candidatus Kapabacteria bacterium]